MIRTSKKRPEKDPIVADLTSCVIAIAIKSKKPRTESPSSEKAEQDTEAKQYKPNDVNQQECLTRQRTASPIPNLTKP